jgi:hypothetical protein
MCDFLPLRRHCAEPKSCEIQTLDPKVIADKIGFSSGTASYVKDKRVEVGNRGAGFLRTGSNVFSLLLPDLTKVFFAVPGEKKETKKKYAVSTKGITASRRLKMEDGVCILPNFPSSFVH